MITRKKKYEALPFEALAKIINGYLLEDGLVLDFKGFRDVLQRYFRVHDHDIVTVHELMIDCNLWYNYFVEVQMVIKLKKEDWTLQADWYYAHEVKACPSEQLENKIQRAKERAKHFSMFAKQLEAQRRFFWKASEHCYELYRRASVAINRVP